MKTSDKKYRIVKCMHDGEIWYKVQTKRLFFWWTYGSFLFDMVFRSVDRANETIDKLKEVRDKKSRLVSNDTPNR